MMTVTHATQLAGVSSSPQSSNDRASMQNTPETKLTAFSPELPRSSHTVAISSGTPRKIPPAFSLVARELQASVDSVAGPSTAPESQDPFFLGGLNEALRKTIEIPEFSQSPQAVTPRSMPSRLPSDLGSVNVTETSKDPTETFERYSAPLINGHKLTAELIAKRVPEQVMPSHSDRRPAFSKIGQFSAESVGTRFIALTQIPTTVVTAQVHGFFGVCLIAMVSVR